MAFMKKNLFCAVLLTLAFSPNLFVSAPGGGGYSAVAGRALKCATCGKTIRGKYLKMNGKRYCSKRCLERSLPKCRVCGKPGRFHSGKKYYCSKKCLEKSWPVCAACHRHARSGVRRGYKNIFLCAECAAKPKCFACSMPADYGRFSDGRYICGKCQKTAVMDYYAAVRVANEVREVMRSKLGLKTNHDIVYKLVGRDGLSGKNDIGQSGTELGLYKFEQTIETYTLTKTAYLGRKTNTN
ncbi:MAG: hypothetical protein GXP32_06975, partial [Kiritimatiellaeota bacterium]|nr:hypothetical protein [Kiritimatiellota bacterium]